MAEDLCVPVGTLQQYFFIAAQIAQPMPFKWARQLRQFGQQIQPGMRTKDSL